MVRHVSGTFYAVDPSTRRPFAEIPETTAEQVAEMVDDARRALAVEHGWPAPRVLGELARLVREQADELTELECRDTGVPLQRAREQVAAAAEALELRTGEGRRLALGPHVLGYTVDAPWGVCALVLSWRSPLVTAARLAGGALAAGNAVIVKPSERASIGPLRLAELAEAAGVPRGMLQVATGDGAVGAALAGDPAVDHVTFSGSARAAGAVAQACARRLVPCELELALAPLHVVCADADLGRAVAAIIRALGSCVLVERAALDDVVARLEAGLEGLTVGPAHEQPDVGPRIDGELVRPAVVHGGEPLETELAVQAVDSAPEPGAPPPGAREAAAPPALRERTAAGRAGAPGQTRMSGSVWTADVARGHRVAAWLPARHVSVNAYTPYPPPGGGPSPYARAKTVAVAL